MVEILVYHLCWTRVLRWTDWGVRDVLEGCVNNVLQGVGASTFHGIHSRDTQNEAKSMFANFLTYCNLDETVLNHSTRFFNCVFRQFKLKKYWPLMLQGVDIHQTLLLTLP